MLFGAFLSFLLVALSLLIEALAIVWLLLEVDRNLQVRASESVAIKFFQSIMPIPGIIVLDVAEGVLSVNGDPAWSKLLAKADNLVIGHIKDVLNE